MTRIAVARAQSGRRHRLDQTAGRADASGGDAAADRARRGPQPPHRDRTVAATALRQPSPPRAADGRAAEPRGAVSARPATVPELQPVEARPAAGVDLGGAPRFRRAAHALEHRRRPAHADSVRRPAPDRDGAREQQDPRRRSAACGRPAHRRGNGVADLLRRLPPPSAIAGWSRSRASRWRWPRPTPPRRPPGRAGAQAAPRRHGRRVPNP